MALNEQTIVVGVTMLETLTNGIYGGPVPGQTNVVGAAGLNANASPAGTSSLITLLQVDRLQSNLVEASWSGSGTVQVQNSSGVSQLSMTAPGRYSIASLPSQVLIKVTAGAPTGVAVKVIALHKGAGF
jgi:hypothetical protein